MLYIFIEKKATFMALAISILPTKRIFRVSWHGICNIAAVPSVKAYMSIVLQAPTMALPHSYGIAL